MGTDKQKEITIQTTQIITTRKELKQSTRANCVYIKKLIDTQRKIIQTQTITTHNHQQLLQYLHKSQLESKDTLKKLMGMQVTMINKNETISKLNQCLENSRNYGANRTLRRLCRTTT